MLVQYILMRTDLESLNPGKMAAQACHAANLSFKRLVDVAPQHEIDSWTEHRGFGTTIVLDCVDDQTILRAIEDLYPPTLHKDKMEGCLVAGSVVDPTYPIRDGKVVHHINLMTCGWAYVETGTPAHEYMKKFSLHP